MDLCVGFPGKADRVSAVVFSNVLIGLKSYFDFPHYQLYFLPSTKQLLVSYLSIPKMILFSSAISSNISLAIRILTLPSSIVCSYCSSLNTFVLFYSLKTSLEFPLAILWFCLTVFSYCMSLLIYIFTSVITSLFLPLFKTQCLLATPFFCVWHSLWFIQRNH